MKAKDIINKLEKLSPKEYACDWDNVGLIVGSEDKEVKKIMVVVDLHEKLLDEAIENKIDMIITHHPIIFKGIKQINDNDFISRKIIKLIKNDISVYAMHTNFDIMGSMAEVAAGKLWLNNLEVLTITTDDGKGLGVVGEMAHLNLKSFSYVIKDTFDIDMVKVYGNLKKLVHKVAILPGAGRSSIDDALKHGADVIITGDITHHDGIDAIEKGIFVIDAGHYGIEKIFIDFISEYLRNNFDDVVVKEENKKEMFSWI